MAYAGWLVAVDAYNNHNDMHYRNSTPIDNSWLPNDYSDYGTRKSGPEANRPGKLSSIGLTLPKHKWNKLVSFMIEEDQSLFFYEIVIHNLCE